MDREGRLTRLEENLCFVETELRGLGEVVGAQQRQLDELLRRVQHLESQLADALAALSERQGPVNAVPPHHVPRLW